MDYTVPLKQIARYKTLTKQLHQSGTELIALSQERAHIFVSTKPKNALIKTHCVKFGISVHKGDKLIRLSYKG